MNLKAVHILGYLAGLFFALEPSYIHPDEHFQSLEILAQHFFGTGRTIPWEFLPENAARSFGPLYLTYGPLFYLYREFGGKQSGLTLLYLVRLQNYLMFTCIYKLALQFLLRSKLDRAKASFYISTSYIGWTYQTHSFSNSLETCALLVVLSLFQALIQDSREQKYTHYRTCAILGFAIAFGVFNRVTFLGFIALPCIPTFTNFYAKHVKSFVVLIIAFALSCTAFIYLDTQLYKTSHWCIAPLNNLRYNLKTSNLVVHGLHPRYTHLLINLPQILGPLLVYFTSRRQRINLTSLSCISGLLFLSAFQHQELRFLIPLMPLLCASIELSNLDTVIPTRYVTGAWIIFNIIFATIMGSLHQRGVLTAIQEMTKNDTQIGVHFWWRSYSPPTWLYFNKDLVVSTTNIVNQEERVDNIDFDITKDHVIDLKGCDYKLFETTAQKFLNQGSGIRVIIPKSSGKLVNRFKESHSNLRVQNIWETYFSLDLDHIDFADISTLTPGITIYEINVL
ncbi:LANO_0D02608g1_1 [Lachancea nothofagi CBS 11611]|uniref:Mannosyltransferase n=1 Tax=Lachancea nothofagi CBS 11611 TaxID=1266666 RepID=A0A1G4JEF9_9SACH|nr:LANO_0D02608g1_1 [Lachancea nothofagi CBS 11611]